MRLLNITSPARAEEELKQVGVDWPGIEAMLPDGLECKVANILKQEMLSIGGDVAVARESVACGIERTDAILIGTPKQMGRLADKLAPQPFGLRGISDDMRRILSNVARDAFSKL